MKIEADLLSISIRWQLSSKRNVAYKGKGKQ